MQLGFPGSGLLQLLQGPVVDLRFSVLPVQLVQRVSQRFTGLPGCFISVRFLRDEGEEVLQKGRILRQIGGLCFRRRVSRLQPRQSLPEGSAVGISLVGQKLSGAEQELLQVYKPGAVKQPSQDLVLFIAGGFEKLPEFPLGQHHDFAELVRIETQQLLTAARDLRGAGNGSHLLPFQLRQKLRVVIAPRGPFLGKLDLAGDGITPAILGKNKLHNCRDGFVHQVGVHHQGLPFAAADLSEQGKDDRVEDRGFSGSRVAGDQVQAVDQLCEVNHGLLRIGAEGRHFEGDRSHFPASFRSACRKSA